jgi:hypothetical protein
MRVISFDRKPPERETLQSIALERHYSVPEVAELWGMSEKSVGSLLKRAVFYDGERPKLPVNVDTAIYEFLRAC